MTRRERLIFWMAVVNFLLFVAIAVPLGGDALNGTARDGHYFLMQHGVYTEVSRSTFIYSMVHTLSVLMAIPLAMIVMVRARSRLRQRD